MSGNIVIGIKEFLELRQDIPVVDVRSPGEFARGHIPNSYNIPLFTDEERATIGTTFKKKGRNKAIIEGLDIVGPQMSQKVKEALKIAKHRKLLLYCWRGGMRSSSLAWLFNQVGIETKTLKGGYKTYRRNAHEVFATDFRFIVLGGMTGSGKTAILSEVKQMGQQVIDLEGLANHKGSAFGGIGQNPQPTTEHFENMLFEELNKLDPQKEIWVEDESHSIGSVFLPKVMYDKMQQSLTIAVERPFAIRADRLEREYAELSPDQLAASVNRISKRLGGDNTKLCIEGITKGEFRKAIEICLGYYDKTYRFGLENHKKEPIKITLDNDMPKYDAEKILSFYQNEIKKTKA